MKNWYVFYSLFSLLLIRTTPAQPIIGGNHGNPPDQTPSFEVLDNKALVVLGSYLSYVIYVRLFQSDFPHDTIFNASDVIALLNDKQYEQAYYYTITHPSLSYTRSSHQFNALDTLLQSLFTQLVADQKVHDTGWLKYTYQDSYHSYWYIAKISELIHNAAKNTDY
jgi:hypothetical protein